MSNGEDVVDNWEEIDEKELNQKLEKLQAQRQSQKQSVTLLTNSSSKNVSEAELPFRPMKLLQRSPNAATAAEKSASALDDMAASFQPVMMLLNKPADEYQGVNYLNPLNTQTVKILRRPTQHNDGRNSDMRPKQPIKTLEQREQEYAEARLRIMGAAKNPEDDANSSLENSAASPAATAASSAAAAPAPAVTATTTTANNLGNHKNNSNTNNAGNKSNNRNASKNHYAGGANTQQQKVHNSQQQQQQKQSNYYYQQNLQNPLQQQGHPAFHNRSAPPPPQQQPLPLMPTPYAAFHNSSPHQPAAQNAKPHQTWSPVVGGSVSIPVSMRQQQDNVMRLPRGPDGSVGFQMRR